jgi:histidinol-phosphatase (PHP family)
VLTDYHVHLRPDEDGTPSGRYFTPENAERYRAAAEERGIAELGVAEHIHRFVQALEVWPHPWYRHWAADDLDEYCAFVREETDLRLGIEADFIPGREDRTANLLDGRDWDYVVGSVHFLREDAVDIPTHDARWSGISAWRSQEPERIWRRYFEALGEAARTGMFDILAHPDLVKVFGSDGPRPDGDLRRFYELAMDGIAESDVAIEVSTAGLRKPAGEIYPAAALLEMCLEAGRPVALSSDAHRPEQLGFEYERAIEWLADVGVSEIATFERRLRRLEPLG